MKFFDDVTRHYRVVFVIQFEINHDVMVYYRAYWLVIFFVVLMDILNAERFHVFFIIKIAVKNHN